MAMTHAQSKFSSPGVARLGIPEVWMTDGPHGIRPEVLWDEWNQAGWTNDSCVAFPALTCLAATWNPEVSLLYGKSIGEEARYRNKPYCWDLESIFTVPHLMDVTLSTWVKILIWQENGSALRARCTAEWSSSMCETLCVKQSGGQPKYNQCDS